MFRDYRDKVQFFYVYKNLAHPEVNNFVPVNSVQERLLHIQRAKEMMQTEMNWICDTLTNDVKERFGGTYNGEFVIDPEGRLLRKRFWSDPIALRKDLVEIIGPVQKETKVEDLETVFQPKARTKVASNVVPKPIMPAQLTPLVVKAKESEDPFFVKLRVEATPELYRGAQGQIVFTAYLDPIYNVHWNNKAGKVKLEVIDSEDSYKFNKMNFESIDVDVDADTDPRWMLGRVQRLFDEPFQLKLTYTVCDDAETFCKEFTQEYTVFAKRDLQGGTRPGIFLNEMFANAKKLDANGDQKLESNELPAGKKTLYTSHLDYNIDGVVSFDEIDQFRSMFNNGKGPDPKNDGR